MGLFGNDNRGNWQNIFDKMKTNLNLTDRQEERIREIIKDFREEKRDLKNEGGKKMHSEIRDERKEMKEDILAVLDDNQRRILNANFDNWRD